MELFFNSGALCVVLKRHGDTALIARLLDTREPFVVPVEHKPGASDWWGGRHFKTLDAALRYLNGEDT